MAYTNTLTGTASIFGLGSTVASFTGAAAVTAKLNSISFSDSSNEVKAADADGQTFAVGYTAFEQGLSVEIVQLQKTSTPVATRSGQAAELTLPPPGAIVALSGFGNNLIDGNWNYAGGGTINLSNNGFMKMTLPVKRFGQTPAALAIFT